MIPRSSVSITLVRAALGVCWLGVAPTLAGAQGRSGAAVVGRVETVDAVPIVGARVELVNRETGNRFQTTTDHGGRFWFESLAPGGYALTASAIGYGPSPRQLFVLAVGRRHVVAVPLAPVRRLAEIQATAVPLDAAGAGGPTIVAGADVVAATPLLGRDVLGLLNATPFGAPGRNGGFSYSGQGTRFNGIEIDGSRGNDVYGIDPDGTPASAASGRAISVEAIREFQVMVAPFDVRYGQFTGGFVNLATRSGTNRFEGSAFGFLQRPGLVGRDPGGLTAGAFRNDQWGAVIGGPIIPNRLHFFAVADLANQATPFAGFSPDDPTTGVLRATAERIRTAIRQRFGFDPGGADSPVIHQSSHNWFGKLTWQPSPRHWLELSYNRVDASLDNFNRRVTNRRNRDGWQLANSGARLASGSATTHLRAVSSMGRVVNEAVVSYQGALERQVLPNIVPLFLVQADQLNTYVAAGSVKSQLTSMAQHGFELTDNLTWHAGGHELTLGGAFQRYRFKDVFFPGSLGVWTFGSVAALEAGQPNRYEVALPVRAGGPVAAFDAGMMAGYLQDRWSPWPSLELTLGVRIDVPVLDYPVENPTLAASTELGRIRTSDLASGYPMLSPRIGFQFQPGSGGRTVIRGGAGVFTARPPLQWFGEAFVSTGLEQVTLSCELADGVPAPTADVTALPRSCLNGGLPTSPPATISYFDPGFRFPQTIKLALGLDQALGDGWMASVDLIHSRSRNQVYVTDVNLVERGVSSEGRRMYGVLGLGGNAQPTRIDGANFGPVYRHENRSADRSTAVTVRVEKNFGRVKTTAGYTWSRSLDLMTVAASSALINLQNNALDGPLDDRVLRPSAFDVPHRLTLTAAADLPLGFGLGVLATAQAGTPYAYVVNGDANADALAGNDLFYIPRNAADITLTDPARYSDLDRFIRSEPCLDRQRGRLMARSSCRNPWVTTLDVRMSKTFGMVGRWIAVTADLFNLPNLIDRDWGVTRVTGLTEELPLLSVAGVDPVHGRPVYAIPTAPGTGESLFPMRRRPQAELSRWRAQLGARVSW